MKTFRLFTAMGTIMSVAVATAPVASADVTPIGPEQSFQGLINGVHDRAQIRVVCDGPGNGHPRAGQTVFVALNLVPTKPSGFTGSTGTSVEAIFFPSSFQPQMLEFTTYNTPQEIPTTMAVPCSGSNTVVFAPQPFSDDAKEDQVTVTFVS